MKCVIVIDGLIVCLGKQDVIAMRVCVEEKKIWRLEGREVGLYSLQSEGVI